MSEFVVVIPARYASTRLPGKALLEISEQLRRAETNFSR